MSTLRNVTPLDYAYVDEYLDERFHFYTYDQEWDYLEEGFITATISACRPHRGFSHTSSDLPHGYSNHIRSMFDLIPDGGYEQNREDEEGYHFTSWESSNRSWDEFENLPPEFSGVYS